jgi:general secretion pathway protein H
LESRSVIHHRPTLGSRPRRGGAARYGHCRRAPGFTLIELLVVVFIIGITVTFAVLSVRSSEDRQLQQDAERLTALIKLARQESIINANELALQFGSNGYRFFVLREGEWRPWDEQQDGQGVFTPREFAEDVRMSVALEGQEISSALAGEEDGDEEPGSAIYILSSVRLLEVLLTLVTAPGGRVYLEAFAGHGLVTVSAQAVNTGGNPLQGQLDVTDLGHVTIDIYCRHISQQIRNRLLAAVMHDAGQFDISLIVGLQQLLTNLLDKLVVHIAQTFPERHDFFPGQRLIHIALL